MPRKRKTQPSPEELTAKGRMATAGTVAAAAAMEPFQANLMGPDAGFDPIHTSLVDRVKQVQSGDLSHVESMLMSQAMALQTMFSSLARLAANQEYVQHQQSYLALAIKAQSASRATPRSSRRPMSPAVTSRSTTRHRTLTRGIQQLRQTNY